MPHREPDPILGEASRLLRDVDLVALPAPRRPAESEVDPAQARRQSRLAREDVIDTVLGVWDLLPASPPPHLRFAWFADADGATVVPEASTSRRVEQPVELLVTAYELLRERGWLTDRGWTTERADVPGVYRLRAMKGHVYVDALARPGSDHFLLRARTAPLEVGPLAEELTALGSQAVEWR